MIRGLRHRSLSHSASNKHPTLARRDRRLPIARAIPALLLGLIHGKSLQAQELWGRGVPVGQVQLTTGGFFEYAEGFLGAESSNAGMAAGWLSPNKKK